METHASATMPKYLLSKFSLIDLDRCFEYFGVELRGTKITEETISLKIFGEKEQIKKAIKGLYSLINSDYKKQIQIETETHKRPTSKVRDSLEKLQDEESYRADYDRLADKYIQDCFARDIKPHPEVVDGFVR